MEVDVYADQSCSQAAFDNSQCIQDNRVVGKSHKDKNQKQEIPKQKKGQGADLLEVGRLRTRGQEGLGGEGEGTCQEENSQRRTRVSTAGATEQGTAQKHCRAVSRSLSFRTLP